MKSLNFINCPLGFSPYVPMRKEWIAEALAGVSALSSIFGGNAAAKAAEEQRKLLRADKASADAGFMYRKHVNYLDTEAGQRLANRAENMYRKSIKQTQAANAVVGGTDARVQMAKDSANNALGEMYADITANETARKDQVDREKRANDRAYAQQMAGIEAQRANAIKDAAQGMSNAMMTAAVAQGNTSDADIKGGSNNGEVVASAVNDTPVRRSAGADNAIVTAAKNMTGVPKEEEYNHFYKTIFSD